MTQPSRGDVWIANLDPVTGHEQGRVRPVVIVSVDGLNHSPAGLAMAVPVTGTDRRLPTHIPVDPPEGGLTKRSYAMCDQLRAISHDRLRKRLGQVDASTTDAIEKILRRLLGLKG